MTTAKAGDLTNYRRGRAVEYKAMGHLAEQGMICARTAGSHSPFDVFGVDPVGRTVTFAQVKRVKGGRKPPSVVLPQSGTYYVRFQLLVWTDRKGFQVIEGTNEVDGGR